MQATVCHNCTCPFLLSYLSTQTTHIKWGTFHACSLKYPFLFHFYLLLEHVHINLYFWNPPLILNHTLSYLQASRQEPTFLCLLNMKSILQLFVCDHRSATRYWLFYLILILDWLEFTLFNDHEPSAEIDNVYTNVLRKLQSTRYYQTAHCTADNVTGLCHLLCSSHSGNKKYSILWKIKWNG